MFLSLGNIQKIKMVRYTCLFQSDTLKMIELLTFAYLGTLPRSDFLSVLCFAES